MRDMKTLAKTDQRDARGAIVMSSLILVVVLIVSIAGAAAPV